MKPNAMILALSALAIFSQTDAHAWGRKLDVQSLVGEWDYVPTPDTAITCPETLHVTYSDDTDSLDSEIFHFYNIYNRLKGDDAVKPIEIDHDHASYYDSWVDIKVKSHSILEESVDQRVTSFLPINPYPYSGPMDSYSPGSMGAAHLAAYNHTKTLEVSYNEKKGILKKTVDMDGTNLGENCSYQRK